MEGEGDRLVELKEEGMCHVCHRAVMPTFGGDVYCGCGKAHRDCLRDKRAIPPPNDFESMTIPNPLWTCPRCMRDYRTEKGRPLSRDTRMIDHDIRMDARWWSSMRSMGMYFLVLILGLSFNDMNGGGGVEIFSKRGFAILIGFPSILSLLVEMLLFRRVATPEQIRKRIAYEYPVLSLSSQKE